MLKIFWEIMKKITDGEKKAREKRIDKIMNKIKSERLF